MFEDLQKLEIPDDSLDSQSQTELPGSPVTAHSGEPKLYPSLSEWLSLLENLVFSFDKLAYEQSLHNREPELRTHHYIQKLYKSVEKLLGEPIGLILDDESPFRDIVEACGEYAETESHFKLLSLLECIEANHFSLASQKPELILDWINKYDPKPDDELMQRVMLNPAPHKHAEFGRYLTQLCTRGMLDKAAACVEASKHEDPLLERFQNLLAAYAPMAAEGDITTWKRRAKALRSGGAGGLERLVNLLLRVFCGEKDAIVECTESWYEVFGCLALFDRRHKYNEYLETALGEKGIDPTAELENAFWDVISEKHLKSILAVDTYDSATAAYVSKMYDDKKLFESYYADLAAEALTEAPKRDVRLVSDYLLTRHAYECLETHQLVPVGVGLLLTPVISYFRRHLPKDIVGVFMPHYECFTNDDLEWAVAVCAKLQLAGTVTQLYVRQGERLLADGHIFEALNMFVKCEPPAMHKIHAVAWDMLFYNGLLGQAVGDLVDDVVHKRVDELFYVHPVIRQCIAPYAVLMEFYSEGDARVRFSKLLSLVRFKHMPARFVPLLLAHMLPLFGTLIVAELVMITETLDLLGPLDGELYEAVVESEGGVFEEAPKTADELVKRLREDVLVGLGRLYIS